MTVSDEELMAYVDGELDARQRASFEDALAADRDLADRTAALQALRGRLQQAFDGTLSEPIPPRLTETVQRSPIVDLRAERLRRGRRPLMVVGWLAAAASLVLGILVGQWMPQLLRETPDFVARGASLAASGELADALSRRLAAEQSPSDRIRLTVSYVANTGEYCRTFIASRDAGSIAGIACRERNAWRIRTLQSVAGAPATNGNYRQAGTSLPQLVLQAAETSMVGEPLDMAAEATARARSWQR
jgi:hypothetical protein